jgi:TRAP-type C4-dicarboxylate transport system permease small subunit
LRAFNTAFDWLLDACAWLACGLLVFQVVSVSAEVVARYFFDISFGAVTALNEWSLVYLTFLGAAWLQREGGHTSDDSMLDMMPAWVRPMSVWLGWLIGVASCGFLVWYGALVTWEAYVTNAYDFFKLREIPIYPVYVIIPFGSLLWLIQLFRASRPSQTSAKAEPIGGKVEA